MDFPAPSLVSQSAPAIPAVCAFRQVPITVRAATKMQRAESWPSAVCKPPETWHQRVTWTVRSRLRCVLVTMSVWRLPTEEEPANSVLPKPSSVWIPWADSVIASRYRRPVSARISLVSASDRELVWPVVATIAAPLRCRSSSTVATWTRRAARSRSRRMRWEPKRTAQAVGMLAVAMKTAARGAAKRSRPTKTAARAASRAPWEAAAARGAVLRSIPSATAAPVGMSVPAKDCRTTKSSVVAAPRRGAAE